MTTKTKDKIRAFYDRRHPEYDRHFHQWRFFRQCYNGGRAWFEDNIFRYHKEGEREFPDRVRRAYRFNHTREVIDLVQKYLFKAQISRNEDKAPQEIKDFWKNATLSGLNIDQLLRSSSTGNSMTGRVAIVVDNNMPKVQTADGGRAKLSVAEAKMVKARIYAYIVQTEDILDYAWDEDGDGGLLWIKLRERTRDDADPINNDGAVIERVRLWTREEWALYEIRVEMPTPRSKPIETVVQVGGDKHNLGRVPVVLHDHTIGDNPYFVPSLIEDIAYLDRAIANYLSNLDAIIQDQTFSQLAIPAQAVQPGDDMYEKVLELGTKRIFTFDGAAQPFYLSPDPKQAGVILTVINKLINEIYHTIGLSGERTKEDNAVGIDNSSGVAKAYDFERVNSLLLSKAASCERVENELADIVMLWSGKAALEEKLVSYPQTFDTMRLADDLVTAEALGQIDAPKEVRRVQMKALVEKMFPQLKDELRKEIESGIDDWLEGEELALNPPSVAGAAAGKTKSSAPSRQGQVTSATK